MSKEDYALTFAKEEPYPVRRLDGGLLRAAAEQSPVKGAELPLSESLFTDDAIIFDRIKAMRSVMRPGRAPGLGSAGLGSKCHGAAFASSASGRNIRRAVPLHRALARLCEPSGLRRRIQRQAGLDAYRSRCGRRVVVPDRGRIVLIDRIGAAAERLKQSPAQRGSAPEADDEPDGEIGRQRHRAGRDDREQNSQTVVHDLKSGSVQKYRLS